MKLRELRIGNIIGGIYTDYDDDSEKHDVCKVVTLDSVGAAGYPIWVEGKANVENYDSFYPIEIDEEWLVRFGFCKIEGNGNFYELSGFRFLVQYVPKSGYLRVDRVGVAVKYVHQLQNLYLALTGEELQLQEPTK